MMSKADKENWKIAKALNLSKIAMETKATPQLKEVLTNAALRATTDAIKIMDHRGYGEKDLDP